MAEFTVVPDFGASRKNKPNVRAIKFGDGYEQRQAVGVNVNQQEWNLRFAARTQVEKTEILDFFEARAGVESFDWTPPGDANAKKFVCSEWDDTIDNHDLYTVTATFRQVYEP